MAVSFSSRLRGFRQQITRLKRAGAAERRAYFRSRPVRAELVCYESFGGNGMLCNPEAIFRGLLADAEFQHFEHVWIIDDDEAAARFRDEFAGHPRVSMVRRGTSDYYRAVATAGYLVNNATFPPHFSKRPGQVYLNTWHGTPLKQMGFDMPDGARQSANTLRNFLHADYLLAANPFMAETMYEDAYRLRNVFAGEIIEEGYPRIDRQWVDEESRQRAEEQLRAAGIDTASRRVVLFAPTWRGTDFAHAGADLDELARRTEQLGRELGGDIVVLLKTHQSVHAIARTREGGMPNLVPNTIPTNVLLGLADGLITDYSSIFFDYLATGRPVAFYTPDADDYEQSRGTYLPLSDLPGPVSGDAAETARALRELMDGSERHPQYGAWQERFVPFDDGDATSRVIAIVFRGEREGFRVRRAATDGRTPIMVYLGGMKSNGITMSALNLLHNIDHEKYDVTVLLAQSRKKQQRANQRRIDPRVRQVFRMGEMNASKAVQVRRYLDNRRLKSRRPSSRGWHTRLWTDEWIRLFGGAKFQWVADYSGYSAFWSNLLLHAPARRRAIWLHNEMMSDRDRTVGGRKPLHRNLSLVFELYPYFDALVSVSPTLTAHNRQGLEAFARPETFKTVRNLPNADVVAAGRAVLLREAALGSAAEEKAGPAWLEELCGRTPDQKWFVNVGRLSPEKNQERLLRAFADVSRERPEARLLIVGQGPLREHLSELIVELGLEGAAFLTGMQRNPWAIMDAADCFVMSSRYEGQPMVILEAALCGMPIVSTRFASVEDALPERTIHIVEQDDAALAAGLRAFLDCEVPPSRLDIPRYTADVLAELDDVIATSNPTAAVRIPKRR